jgi:hypothetical protein
MGLALEVKEVKGEKQAALAEYRKASELDPGNKQFRPFYRSRLDWRLLCPGPMVDEPAIGLDRLRISLDALAVSVPAFARAVPAPLLLPVFASVIPQMIVPYADAAALMLANFDRGNAMSRHRVGLALPVGMRGRKSQWSAKSQSPGDQNSNCAPILNRRGSMTPSGCNQRGP